MRLPTLWVLAVLALLILGVCGEALVAAAYGVTNVPIP